MSGLHKFNHDITVKRIINIIHKEASSFGMVLNQDFDYEYRIKIYK